MTGTAVTEDDLTVIAEHLGRRPRGVRAVSFRCPSGHPTVVQTAPRLPDGTPFPTLYYLTCRVLTAAVSRLEAAGVMRELTDRLQQDPAFASAYLEAHQRYLAERDAIAALGTDVSAGGMPARVKCLHVHVAHSLAAGPWSNPVGDEALRRVGDWHSGTECASEYAL